MNENIFSGGIFQRGSIRTGANLSTTSERLCSTCINYNKKNNILMDFNIDKIRNTGFKKLSCRLIGKIKNPNCIFCSWYKKKE